MQTVDDQSEYCMLRAYRMWTIYYQSIYVTRTRFKWTQKQLCEFCTLRSIFTVMKMIENDDDDDDFDYRQDFSWEILNRKRFVI